MQINPGSSFQRFIFVAAFFLAAFLPATAQVGTIQGTVRDSSGAKLESAVIGYIGGKKGAYSKSDGSYSLQVPADSTITLVVRLTGYSEFRRPVTVASGAILRVDVMLARVDMQTAEIKDRRSPEYLDPKPFEHLPAPIPDISAYLRFVGAQSSNELSTQYSVRGGNFDENLVYVNDIEVYRPFLIRSGQQEGLSFVNTDMTQDIFFSAGGFEAKYGDKMSSVLDIRYRRPDTTVSGVVSMSLLGVNAEVDGMSENLRFTWMLGIRNKSNRYLLRSLDTRGDYRANFTDVQTFLTYTFDDRWSVEYLGNYAINRYELTPLTRETDFGTLNNALRFTVFFDGREDNRFNTMFNAVSLNYEKNRWRSKLIFSSFNTFEVETFDVQGQYKIDQLEADFGKPTFGQVAFNRGVGTFLNHARNYLDAWVNNVELKAWRTTTHYTWSLGVRYQNERITDELSEWSMVDSVGYSIPFLPENSLDLQDVVKTRAQLFSNRGMAYAQVRYVNTLKDSSDIILTVGTRANYWDLNGQLIVSPRAEVKWMPYWFSGDSTNRRRVNLTLRAAGGLYTQSPFYRELRGFDGSLNRDIKAQTSVHAIVGGDLSFLMWKRPFRFITEAYYKYLDNLIPYEVNDVRIRYFGQNLARGYAYGLDLRLSGQFVKGVDSWVNLSILRTREDLYNDQYYLYLNSEGDTIIPGFTLNNVPTDSLLQDPGFIPRPTDQLITFALYFQDYLPILPDCKMNLGLILGTGLPFGPPTHERYKAVFRMPPYRRVDIGFSYQLIKEEKPLKVTSPFRFVKSLWIGAEVFNLLQVQNTLSYYWVKDVTGRSYAIPNYLTNRQLSVRMIMHF